MSFNAEATIARTIKSVINQTYNNIEYIIIDGASKDNTAEIARSFIPKFEKISGRSMKVISEPDKGMYDALNKGAAMAHGAIVGNINADDWYEPDAVEFMADLFERENFDLAWGSLRVLDDNKERIKHAKFSKNKFLWSTLHWCHPAAFSRREILLEYPYPLINSHDDFDYATHVFLDGKKIVTTDKIISTFNIGGMSTGRTIKDAKQRLDDIYGIYKRYGMGRIHYFRRLLFEVAKYLILKINP
ncbi:MAG: glycosyltransferase [Synergistaceae bacterium]|nr:glycosyltransferase [Synergistaceae bacterium]